MHYLAKIREYLTKKGGEQTLHLLDIEKEFLFLVLNSQLLNKLVLYIARNQLICRRRHNERCTTTGE